MKRYHLGILSLGLGMMLASCNSGSGDKGILSGVSDMFDSGLSEESLQKALQSGASLDSTVYKRAGVIQSEIATLYQKRGNKPLWIDGKSISEKGKKAIASIGKLGLDGLDPQRYEFEKLQQALNAKESTEDNLASTEVLLTRSLALAASDLTFGLLNPAEVDKEWHSDNDSVFSFAEILQSDSLSKDNVLDAFRPANPRYALMQQEMEKWGRLKSDTAYMKYKDLVKSGSLSVLPDLIRKEIHSDDADSALIKSYQYLNHLSTTGKIDEELIKTAKRNPDDYITQLKINMERMRWLPNKMNDHYIWVSIPQAEIDYYKGGHNLFHNRTIVGSRTNRTPSLLKPMQNIVICPPWGVPLSIVGKEYGGRIPAKYEVYRGGKRVPNSMVNAGNYKQFAVRQPPGPAAALGYVKFNLPNKWDIYLHDTPGRSLFANKVRYMSHGCVRVKEPRVLASLILESQNIGIDSINTMIKKNRTTPINTDKIPVYISYFTANADSTMKNMLYLSDPYRKDSVLIQKLALK